MNKVMRGNAHSWVDSLDMWTVQADPERLGRPERFYAVRPEDIHKFVDNLMDQIDKIHEQELVIAQESVVNTRVAAEAFRDHHKQNGWPCDGNCAPLLNLFAVLRGELHEASWPPKDRTCPRCGVSNPHSLQDCIVFYKRQQEGKA